MRATVAKINLENLTFNLNQIKSRMPKGAKICLPVKADAYGHGAVGVARAAEKWGTDFLAVAACYEAAELREAKVSAPILLLSQCVPEEIPDLIENRITPLVSDFEFAKMLDDEARKKGVLQDIHLAIDTGMHRSGCDFCDAKKVALQISELKNVALRGVCTHFSTAPTSDSGAAFLDLQISRFKSACKELRGANFNLLAHASASVGFLSQKDAAFDMIRPGILAYGYAPDEKMKGKIPVKPVMTLESRIVGLRNIAAGETVSYGNTWTAQKDTQIALVPIGYGDGLPRLASGKIFFKIAGRLYPQVGRICMDLCLVDLGAKSGVCRWDKVEIFGENSPDACEKIATAAETIPYEIICRIAPRVPRIFL